MGEGVLHYYITRIRKEYKIAFYSTFIIALLIHIYKFTNTLPNHDSLYNYYSTQNAVGSGRWALSFVCGISSYWDLPWVNGLISCVFIALTTVVLVSLFKLRNLVLIILSGALLAASPSTTETLFFLFTADGFFAAMFLAALSVYFSKIGENRISRFILSGVCICITCGIYQAYVSFALVLAVCCLIDNLLLNDNKKKDYLIWIIRQIIIYCIALAAYYIIWKTWLHISGTTAVDYQGISEVGTISLHLIAEGFIKSIRSIIVYFMQWDVIEHGFTLYSVLCIIFVVIMICGLIIAFIKSEILKRKWAVVLFVLALCAIIPFSCMWHFVSDSVRYRPMMLQSMTVLFVLTAVLFERWARLLFKNAVCSFLLLIVFINAVMANISYYYMNLSYERSYADAVEMKIGIHDLQSKYNINSIAIIGNRLAEVQWEFSNPDNGKITPVGEIHMFSSMFETNLLYDSDHTVPFLQNVMGVNLDSVSKLKASELSSLPEVQSMECWPNDGSMRVMDGVLIIKLSDE